MSNTKLVTKNGEQRVFTVLCAVILLLALTIGIFAFIPSGISASASGNTNLDAITFRMYHDGDYAHVLIAIPDNFAPIINGTASTFYDFSITGRYVENGVTKYLDFYGGQATINDALSLGSIFWESAPLNFEGDYYVWNVFDLENENEYTVEFLFVKNGAILLSGQSVRFSSEDIVNNNGGNQFEFLETPTREHYDFVGWFLDADCTIPYDERPILSDTDIYAGWKIKKYTVRYVFNHGGLFTVLHIDALTNYATALPNPRTGYNFEGWFVDEDFTTAYVEGTPLTGNLVLYADWDILLLTVRFIVNGKIYAEVFVPYGFTLAEAVSQAQSASVVFTEMYYDGAFSTPMSASTVLTESTGVHVKVSSGTEERVGFFKSIGNWFSENWLYFPITVGCVGVGAFIVFIILRRKGAI